MALSRHPCTCCVRVYIGPLQRDTFPSGVFIACGRPTSVSDRYCSSWRVLTLLVCVTLANCMRWLLQQAGSCSGNSAQCKKQPTLKQSVKQIAIFASCSIVHVKQQHGPQERPICQRCAEKTSRQHLVSRIWQQGTHRFQESAPMRKRAAAAKLLGLCPILRLAHGVGCNKKTFQQRLPEIGNAG